MSLEKQLVQTLEPLVDQLVAVEKRLEAIQLTPGPAGSDGKDGADADVEAVVEVLVSRHADVLRGAPGANGVPGEAGPAGADGRDGKDIEPDEIIAKLIPLLPVPRDGTDGADGIGIKGDPGTDGKDADPETVAEIIVAKHGMALRGVPGDPGRDGNDGLGIEVPVWAGQVFREGQAVTHNQGQFFRALRDTAAEPGASDDWVRLGKAGTRYCGAFDAERAYEDGDMYIKNFGTFTVLNGEHKLTAGRGQKGDIGPRGPVGEPGRTGEAGAKILAFEAVGTKLALVTDFQGKQDTFTADFSELLANAQDTVALHHKSYLEEQLAAAKKAATDLVTRHPTIEAGVPLQFYCGVWRADTSGYRRGDMVHHDGKLFVAVGDTPLGNQPGGNRTLLKGFVEDTYWRPLGSTGSAPTAQAFLSGAIDLQADGAAHTLDCGTF